MSVSDEVRLVTVSYHQAHLAPLDVSPTFGPEALEGFAMPLALVTNSESALVIFTGCADGPVQLHVRLHQTPPPVAEGAWEEREEVSMVIRGPLIPASPTAYEFHQPVLTDAAPGRHRVRVSARGRGSNYDSSVLELAEWYLVEFWPEGA